MNDAFVRDLNVRDAYRVGGSVRDELLGIVPRDGDYIVTGVTLEQLGSQLDNPSPIALRTGQQVGWRTHDGLEIVIPRSEISTGSGRHDFDIYVDPDISLELDAERRDFTVNALYFDLRTLEVLDPLCAGINDCRARVVRTTNPRSFSYDPLRVLRALRLCSTHKMGLALRTLMQMNEYAESVTALTQKGVSATALNELTRILGGKNVGYALDTMRDTGVLAALLPELRPMIGFQQHSQYHNKTVDEHTFDAIAALGKLPSAPPDRVLLALLFHDCGKPASAWTDDEGWTHYYARSDDELSHEEIGAKIAYTALTRLGAPRRLRNDVVHLVRHHMVPLKAKATRARRMRVEHGDDMLGDLLMLRTADVLGKSDESNNEALNELMRTSVYVAFSILHGVPASTKDLPVDGFDMMNVGWRGKSVGLVLAKLLDEVVCQPELNDRDWLMERAAVLLRKGL